MGPLGGADLRFVALSHAPVWQLIPLNLRHGTSASRSVSAFFPAKVGAHSTDPRGME